MTYLLASEQWAIAGHMVWAVPMCFATPIFFVGVAIGSHFMGKEWSRKFRALSDELDPQMEKAKALGESLETCRKQQIADNERANNLERTLMDIRDAINDALPGNKNVAIYTDHTGSDKSITVGDLASYIAFSQPGSQETCDTGDPA